MTNRYSSPSEAAQDLMRIGLFPRVGQHVRRGVQIAAVLDLSGDHMPADGALDRPENVYELMQAAYTRVFSPGENAC